MSRAPSTKNDPGLSPLTAMSGLTGFNRQPLTPEQQMQALKRVQAQAEQRVKLGMQLFKAAEARLSNQTDVVQQIKTLQKQLREQVNNDVAQSLHQYDQWIGQIDESFTTAIRKLEQKVDAVQANISKSEARMREMLDRAEALLDQSRNLIERNSLKLPEMPKAPQHVAPPAAKPTPPAAPPARKPSAASAPTPPVAMPKPPAASQAPKAQPVATPPKPATPNADTDLHAGSHKLPNAAQPADTGEEKIYSKFLQRLIEDAPGTAPGGAPGKSDTGPQKADAPDDEPGNAHAA